MTTISKAVAEAFFLGFTTFSFSLKFPRCFFFRFEIWVSVCNESKTKVYRRKSVFFGRASSISLLTQKIDHFNFLSWDQHLMMKSLQLYHYCVYHNNQETVVFGRVGGFSYHVFFLKLFFFREFFFQCVISFLINTVEWSEIWAKLRCVYVLKS